MTQAKTLRLVCERKIGDLLPGGDADDGWESSGVLAKDGAYFVAFDNRAAVAVLAENLQSTEANGLFGPARDEQGYEGIAYNARKARFYLLIEALKHKRGRYRPMIVECNDRFERLKSRPMDFEFDSANRGFEAVGYARRNGRDHLLALCEGNKCRCGRKGRKPGGGRVQIFEKAKDCWSHVGTIKLPKSVLFTDYSAMAFDGHRVAITSQENSMLWVGDFEEAAWEWRDAGQVFEFPRTTDGDILYGNVEGVSWAGPGRVVTVSDRRKEDQPARCADKDQSIHVFELTD